MGKYILEMRNITKTFPGVKALDNVNFRVIPRHIHALVGENGAGKSTLMNILSAVYPHGTYEGDIVVDGEVCVFKSIKDSEAKGIAIIHQELALIPSLSIAENVFLGNEQTDKGLVINWDKTRTRTTEMLKKVGLDERTDTKIKDIGLGKQQLVEIVKALAKDVRLLILDEPTSGLDPVSRDEILQIFLDLVERGITILFSTHITSDLDYCADNIIYIKNGEIIAENKLSVFIDQYQILEFNKEYLNENLITKALGHRRTKNGTSLLFFKDAVVQEPHKRIKTDLDAIMVHLEQENHL